VPVGARRYDETDAFAQRAAAIITTVEAPMISVDAAGAAGGPAASSGPIETVDALTLLHAPVATTARRLGVPETHARQLRLRAIEALVADEEG